MQVERAGRSSPAWSSGMLAQPTALVGREAPAQRSAGPTPGRPVERQLAILTRREREVAAELVITPATVERHVANILNKLALGSRSQVAVWAVEHGLAGYRPR